MTGIGITNPNHKALPLSLSEALTLYEALNIEPRADLTCVRLRIGQLISQFQIEQRTGLTGRRLHRGRQTR